MHSCVLELVVVEAVRHREVEDPDQGLVDVFTVEVSVEVGELDSQLSDDVSDDARVFAVLIAQLFIAIRDC